MKTPVIDFHLHLPHYETYQPSVVKFLERTRSQAMPEFIRHYSQQDNFWGMLQEAGVDYGVVLAELSPITTGICSNELVAGFCREHPGLIPFASINPMTSRGLDRELTRLVKEEGFRGLKLYPTYQYFYPNDALLYPLYARAEELGIPVMLHTGSSVFQGSRLKYGDPLYLDDVAVDFPSLHILLVHGGRGFWYDRAAFLARLHPNVYVEIAGLPPQKLPQFFPDLERVAEKMIYGTDWPAAEVDRNIAAIRRLPLSPHLIEGILGGNAARILKLTPI